VQFIQNIVVNYSTCQLLISIHKLSNIKSTSSFVQFLRMASSITIIIFEKYIFSAMSTSMTNARAKFYWNPFT